MWPLNWNHPLEPAAVTSWICDRRQWLHLSPDLLGASSSLVRAKFHRAPPPPTLDCWQACSYADSVQALAFAMSLWLQWLRLSQEMAFYRAFLCHPHPRFFPSPWCPLSLRGCGINVLFKAEHKPILLLNTLGCCEPTHWKERFLWFLRVPCVSG